MDRCPRRGCICCAALTARFTRVGPSISSADLRVIEPAPRVATRPAGCPSSLRMRYRWGPHRRAPRGGTRQTAIAACQARVAQRRSGARNDQRWGHPGGPMSGGALLRQSHPMDRTRLRGTRGRGGVAHVARGRCFVAEERSPRGRAAATVRCRTAQQRQLLDVSLSQFSDRLPLAPCREAAGVIVLGDPQRCRAEEHP
jgi:hypothetical protein